ncbi:UPF0481 protein At3g47200-like [Quercus robur]|uniref:UPF0481 protein At3g47200-like n=1 Tax=Quercus robur TaxID=38942 RepID=UPI002163F168|nr:UPF0481 protein At3g47200-like [Quercus robur]XP_050282421.1 UPF0481 protein At3g47200-like [Quercus robur]XP_050282422.1 UPF0481 protein At3g47200-like [Quercus robur]
MDSDTNSSHGKEPECPEIIIDVENAKPAQRCSECCIYMVPKKLREVKKEAYTPKLISIGPVHHNKELNHMDHHNKNEVDNKKEQENMESLKLRYFNEFFCRRTWKGQKEFANIIIKNEENIRQCYAEEISLPGKEDFVFVKMILLDSIFIIELFLRTASRSGYEKDDYILSKPWLEEGIKHDLILLENQLPFFILEQLYHHIGVFPEDRSSFLELACKYFFGEKKFSIVNKVKHFTDLQRYFYYSPKLKSSNDIIAHLYSATKLDTAGLNFKKWKEEPSELEDRRLLDIQIENPDPLKIFPCFNCSSLLHCLPCLKCFWCLKRMQTSLVIPPFEINHGTEHIFRNIMALEQCHYPKEAYICNYIVLLDFLINTRDDAELLVDKKIIVHSLGSNKEVAKMVNKLGKEILEKNSCYLQLAKNLNEHYENWWNKNIASLKTVYFRDIWRGSATFVGIIVLLVTVGNFLRPFVFHK